jgi:hypothetical protein
MSSEIIPDWIRERSLKLAVKYQVDATEIFALASAAYLDGIGEKASRVTKPDPTYEAFASAFERNRSIPYKSTKGDFVQLADLRKRLSLATREMPPGWDRMCENYFGSDLMVRYTLADLCARADIFMRQSLRRFNGQSTSGSTSPAGQADKTTRGERRFSRQ